MWKIDIIMNVTTANGNNINTYISGGVMSTLLFYWNIEVVLSSFYRGENWGLVPSVSQLRGTYPYSLYFF